MKKKLDTKPNSKKERKKGDRNTNHISLEGLTDGHNFDIKECKTTGVTSTLQIFSPLKLQFLLCLNFNCKSTVFRLFSKCRRTAHPINLHLLFQKSWVSYQKTNKKNTDA